MKINGGSVWRADSDTWTRTGKQEVMREEEL
jgi:hypothetical protein